MQDFEQKYSNILVYFEILGQNIAVCTLVRTYIRRAERPSAFGRSGLRLGWLYSKGRAEYTKIFLTNPCVCRKKAVTLQRQSCET